MDKTKDDTITLVILKNMQDMIKTYLDNDKQFKDKINKDLYILTEKVENIEKLLKENPNIENREIIVEMVDKYKKKKFFMIPNITRKC